MYARRTVSNRFYLFAGLIAIVLLGTWWFVLREPGGGASGANAGQNSESNAQLSGDDGLNESAVLPGDDDSQFTGGEDTSSLQTSNDRENDDTHNMPTITMGESKPSADRTASEPAGAAPDRNHGTADTPRTIADRQREEKLRTPTSSTVAEDTQDESGQPNPTRTIGSQPGTQVNRLLALAGEKYKENDLVEARRLYNEALQHAQVGRAAGAIRERMQAINAVLIFSPTIATGDPFVSGHRIESGDRLVHLAPAHGVDWRLLERVNETTALKIQLGQTIKIVHGPFHAVVDKSDFRLDLYVGEPNALGHRMYVRSFPVGLGESGSTPEGSWVVAKNSKVKDPAWTNPRTREHFKKDDPKNPIGDYWIGLQGTDPVTQGMSGYGIHGTIEPESIGREASMGCVRLGDGDIEWVFSMLVPEQSTVVIQP